MSAGPPPSREPASAGVPAANWTLACVDCGRSFPASDPRYRCDCGGTLDVRHDLPSLRGSLDLALFDRRLASKSPIDRSGVWRFRELVLPLDPGHIVARGEGATTLYEIASHSPLARFAGVARLLLKHEGENPTGSFKDRGMTTGVSMARRLGMTRVACASTGNTSASMASYAALAGMKAFVFIPAGNIASGKLAQALAYGARTIQIEGDFDAAMRLVEEVSVCEGIYLLNSLNPYRLEGQKTIGFELLQDLDWQIPDWLVVPGGNLGNNSAIAKGLAELRDLGLIDRLPRLAVIQAAGANPLYRAVAAGSATLTPVDKPQTIATAIKIGNPVSFARSLRALRLLDGVVEQVSDQELMDAKALVDAAGVGAEPASCVTVAGLSKLVAAGKIPPTASVACVLTGHLLKDPDATAGYHMNELAGLSPAHANRPVRCGATLAEVLAAMN